MQPQDPSFKFYAAPKGDREQAATSGEPPDRWTVFGVLRAAYRSYAKYPMQSVVGIGLIPQLVTQPPRWLVSTETEDDWPFIILSAVLSALVLPGRTFIAVSIAKNDPAPLVSLVEKLKHAPVALLQSAPVTVASIPLVVISQDATFPGTVLLFFPLTMLLLVAAFVSLRWAFVVYPVVDANCSVRSAISFSWQQTAKRWKALIGLALLLGAFMWIPHGASLMGVVGIDMALRSLLFCVCGPGPRPRLPGDERRACGLKGRRPDWELEGVHDGQRAIGRARVLFTTSTAPKNRNRDAV